MAKTSAPYIWSMRLVYVALCGVVIMLHLLPVGQTGHISFAPDVILCLTLAWVIRRPEVVSILMIAVVTLLADMLLMRVPGLWAALTVVLANSIVGQRRRFLQADFRYEWFRVSLGIAAIFLAHRVALILLFVETPPLVTSLSQLAATLLAYPVVVAVSAAVFRVRKPDLIEAGLGRRRL